MAKSVYPAPWESSSADWSSHEGCSTLTTARESRPYRQAVPALGLSLECGAPDVPDDGKFHVVMNRTVIYSAASQKDALREYRAVRDHLLPPKTKPIDARRVLEREVA